MNMTPAELLRELQELNKRLQVRADQLERERLRSITAIASNYAELRWLEKDYNDERNGDWTR